MIAEIRRRFRDTILHEALRRSGHAPDAACAALDGFEAHVFRLPGEILKITHTLRRSEAYLAGELEFVAHLAEGGVGAARPIPFPSGRLVEPISDGEGGSFLAYRFVEVRGRATDFADWSEALIEAWGALAGRMCRVGRTFRPSRPEHRRQRWDEDPLLDLAARLPPERAETAERCRALLRRIGAMPRTPQTYGLVHGDLHHYNFLVDDEGQITAFDFDDCAYHYLASEVAVPLYYAAGSAPAGEGAPSRAAFAEHFLACFVRGYQQEDPLTRTQLEALPDLLMLRVALLLGILYANEFEDAEEKARLLGVMHRRIDEGVPVIDLDFARLARQLAAGS